MARNTTPIDLWSAGLQVGQMLVETQLVVAYRLMGMAGLWAVAAGENERMVSEKAPAFAEAAWAASHAAMVGKRPDEVMGAWVRPLRRRTRINARRLGRRGWRR